MMIVKSSGEFHELGMWQSHRTPAFGVNCQKMSGENSFDG